MPSQKTEGSDHPVTTITCGVGEQVGLCRCWKSQTFPFCDGSHRQEVGMGPALVIVPAAAKPEEKAA